VAVIVVGETTVKPAFEVLNFTAVAPVKFVPVIVTVERGAPLVGVKLVTVGTARTVKFVALLAVPPEVVTVIGPVVAPAGTVAITCEPLTLKVALVPLNLTAVVPVRFAPLIVTDVPTPPLPGEKLLIVGPDADVTVKAVAVVAVPPGVTTVIGPVVAMAGTVAVICVTDATV